MLEFLPIKIKSKLSSYNNKNLYEIRMRRNKPLSIIYLGKIIKLSDFIVSKEDIEEAVLNACKRSIYSYDEQIKQGFITTDLGERIGLSGEFVIEDNIVKAIRSFTSLCIRIPCEVNGVSYEFVNNIYSGGSVLVVSKTGVGKTTFIRDFCKNISNKTQDNIVVIDERNEIAGKNDDFTFDLGESADVLTFCNKDYGFKQAIRTLNPNYIFTDELISYEDCKGVYSAILSGINVIATVHSNSIENLKQKSMLDPLIKDCLFEYYLLLKYDKGVRNVEIFNKKLEYLCCI